MDSPRPPSFFSLGKQTLAGWLLGTFAALVAAFETICLNSLFAGHPAPGAFQALAVFALLIGIPAFRLTPPALRHRNFSRCAAALSIFAVVCLVALRGKAAQLEAAGARAAEVAFAPTLVVLLLQCALALVYVGATHRRAGPGGGGGPSVPRWLWGSAGLFAPVVLIGGLALHHLLPALPTAPAPSPPAVTAAAAPGHAKFSRFPRDEDFEFTRPTERVGQDSGGQFLHYHTGQRPLRGVIFTTRDWMGGIRVSNDLRGIFEREAEFFGENVLVATPGYVVVGMQVQAREYVEALRLRFARLEEDGLDTDDAYWSSWGGDYQRGGRTQEIGNGDEIVMGILGTAGLVVNSLGLLVEHEEPAPSRFTR